MGPYVNVNGVIIANNYDDLVDGSLLTTPDVTEDGVAAAVPFAWTATNFNGTPTSGGRNCTGWTNAGPGTTDAQRGWNGKGDETDEDWTTNGVVNCSNNSTFGLYCAAQ